MLYSPYSLAPSILPIVMPSFPSYLPSLISRAYILSIISCLLSLVSCLLSLVSCLLSPVLLISYMSHPRGCIFSVSLLVAPNYQPSSILIITPHSYADYIHRSALNNLSSQLRVAYLGNAVLHSVAKPFTKEGLFLSLFSFPLLILYLLYLSLLRFPLSPLLLVVLISTLQRWYHRRLKNS